MFAADERLVYYVRCQATIVARVDAFSVNHVEPIEMVVDSYSVFIV